MDQRQIPTQKQVLSWQHAMDFSRVKADLCLHCRGKIRTAMSIHIGYCRFCRSQGRHIP